MATTAHVPLILIRGFGGLSAEDERQVAYQGFNDGTVYPQKRGENYIYEGLILRFMKSDWQYHDATNVVGYYATRSRARPMPARTARASTRLLHRQNRRRPGHGLELVTARPRTRAGRSGCSATTT